MASVKVPIELELSKANSEIERLKKAFESISKDTVIGKSLETQIARAERSLNRLKASTANPLGSKSEINQVGHEWEHLQDILGAIAKVATQIDFSSLKLDPQAVKQVQDFENKINELKKKSTPQNVRKERTSELVSANSDFLSGQGVDVTKSGNALAKDIERKANAIGVAVTKYREEVKKYQEAQELIKNSTIKDDVTQDKINEYFNRSNVKSKYFQGTGSLTQNADKQKNFSNDLQKAFGFSPEQIAKVFSDNTALEKVKSAFQSMLNELNAAKDIQPVTIINDEQMEADMAKLRQLKEELGVIFQGEDDGSKQKFEEYSRLLTEMEQKFAAFKAAQVDAVKTSSDTAKAQKVVGEAAETAGDKISSATASLQKMSVREREMTGMIQGLFRAFSMTSLVYKGINAIKQAINHIEELDKAINKIAVVNSQSSSDLWGQISEYSELAKQYGVTIQGAYEVSAIYYQAGYDVNEVMGLTTETLKLAKIAGLDYATTTDYMLTALRGFKMELSDASSVVDTYAALSAATAVSSEELAVAISKVAASAESVGSSFSETSAMLSVMIANTRESASSIGMALKTVMSAYGELTSSVDGIAETSDGDTLYYNKVDEALSSVGITIKDSAGQFRSFTDVILELSDAWGTLNSTQQRYIATQFAGSRFYMLAAA